MMTSSAPSFRTSSSFTTGTMGTMGTTGGAFAAALLGIVALGWGASGTAGERAIVTPQGLESSRVADLDSLQKLEAQDATDLDKPAHVLALGDAYLGAHAPGLALHVVESSTSAVRANPSIEHLYARALFDEGRASESLAAERRVLERCRPLGDLHAVTDIEGCDARTVVSATRRSEYLEQVLALGVEDPQAHPEASQVAYLASTRDVSLALR